MKLSRRTALRGFGTWVALPFLEAFEARAQQAPVKRRFVAFQTPNGVNLRRWNGAADPNAAATFTALSQSPTLAPLLPDHASYLTQINGLSVRHVGATGHHQAVSGWLTDATCMNGAVRLCVNPPSADDLICPPAGVSLDQLLAARLPRETRFRSLQLGPFGQGDPSDAVCGNMACPYLFNVSWLDGSTPAGREMDGRRAFDRIFAGSSPAQTVAARERRRQQRLRVADFVKDDTRRLSAQLGRDDRRRLDQYFSAIAALEDDLRNAPPPATCNTGAPLEEVGDAFADPRPYLRVFRRIMTLALQCDLSRIITFMVSYSGQPGYGHLRSALAGNGPASGGAWRYSNGSTSNVPLAPHHELSHWTADAANDAPSLGEFQQMKLHALGVIDRFYADELGALLTDLRAIDDGDGKNLLDNTLVYYGADMSDPDLHSTRNLPLLLAGGAAGALPGNRVLNFDGGAAANLHLAIANLFGVPITTFGNDGTRALTGVFQ